MIFNSIIYFITLTLAWIGVIYVYLKEKDVKNKDSR